MHEYDNFIPISQIPPCTIPKISDLHKYKF